MFSTLRNQALFSVVTVMASAAAVIIFISYFHAKNAVEEIKEESARKTLHSIELSLIDNYDYLIDSKYEHIDDLKNKLKSTVVGNVTFYKSFTENIQNVLNEFPISSGIDRDSYALWVKMISSWFDFSLQDSRIGWLLIDKEGNVLKSTDPALQSINVNNFIDFNEEPFGERYYGNSLSHSGQFVVFHDHFHNHAQGEDQKNEKPVWQLGYFSPLFHDNITIAAFVNINNLMDKEGEWINKIKDSVKKIISGSKVSKSGFVLIFDKNKDFFIDLNKSLESVKNKRDNFLQTFINSNNTIAYFSAIKKKCVVYTKYFEGFDWYISVAIPVDEIVMPAKNLALKQLFVIAIIFAICILLVVWGIYAATAPLQILSRKIEKVPDHDFTSADQSELIDGLPVTTKNEIGKLAQTFAFMIKELSGSIKQLVETTAANERIESELNVARDIQLGTLPKDFSFEPERKALDIYAYLIPAREIGGDLYDFFFIDDDNLCFTLGDVAGKGVPAALFMVIAKKLINNNAHTGGKNISPAEIMNQVNEIIYQDNPNSTFVTLFIGILNIKTGQLRYANGGHVPPIFVDCNSEPYYKKDLSGPVVGAIPGIKYKEIVMTIQPGGAVFLCTDGVTEAMNEKDELFGDPRLLEDFAGVKNKSSKEAVEAILHEVRTHAGKAPQSDDIAMMMVRWGVNEEQNTERNITIN